MADVKISGLPASTTPLAGTEVLPVVQGGVTKKVAVSDLTSGRAVSAAGVTDTSLTASKPVFTDANKKLTSTGTLAVDQGGTGLTSLTANRVPYGNGTSAFNSNANFTYDGSSLAVGTSGDTVATFTVLNKGFDSPGNFRIFTANPQAVNLGGSMSFGGLNGSAGAFDPWAFGVIKGAKENSTSNNYSGYLAFGTASSGGGIGERLRITSAGDVNIVSGNVVMATSGKGIDFSATAGTGTSELLADYEEGDWTPVIGASSGAITSYTTTNCKYTKIGRQVTLNGTFGITNNGTGIGAVTISSVPFAILNSIAGGVAREAAVNGLMSMIVAGNTGTFNMTRYDNVYPGVTGGSYTFTITYFV